MKKIALLISTKSFERYQTANDFVFINNCLQSLLINISLKNNIYIYFGYDNGDTYFEKNINDIINKISNIIKKYACSVLVNFCFIQISNPEKGNPCYIWNKLFKHAYEEKNDYFFQMGDDIIIALPNWDDIFINKLIENDNIGVTGLNAGNKMITQSFVSRKHYEIFGTFFNKKFKNWGCDDWINQVYQPYLVYQFPQAISRNKETVLVSGSGRYVPYNFSNFFSETVINDKIILQKYIEKFRHFNKKFTTIKSISTIGISQQFKEIFLLLSSINILNNKIKIYIAGDKQLIKLIRIYFNELDIKTLYIPKLDKLNNFNIDSLEYDPNYIIDYALIKFKLCKFALINSENTLFIKNNIFLTNSLPIIPNKKLGLCFNNKNIEIKEQIGVFNSNYIFINNKQILKKWESIVISNISKSEYYEQKLLNNLTLNNFKISENMNINKNSSIKLRINSLYLNDNIVQFINLNMFRYKTQYHENLVKMMKQSKNTQLNIIANIIIKLNRYKEANKLILNE
jgi:hypothetical protein